jgi:YD repeat-containing protein
MPSVRAVAVSSVLAVCGSLLFISPLAAHAPTIFYRVSNDAVRTDRFSSPEEAGRTSIERKGFASWVYSHITPVSSHEWQIYYDFHRSDGTVLPDQPSSLVTRYLMCDPTPMIGPNYASDAQGLPKNHSSNPNAYPNGCPNPPVNAEKNACESNCAGNPVNVGNMNKVQRETDYVGPGAFALRFERRYDSNGFNDNAFLPFRTLGSRWRHTYDRSVTVATVSGITTAAVVRPDGRNLRFTLTAGSWVPDADIEDTLVQLTDGSGNPTGWLYTTTDHDTEAYNANGRLLALTDRAGITQTLAYSDGSTPPAIAATAGLLIGVTDSFGRTMQFTYNATNRIATMTDPAGGVFVYAYQSNGMLQTVTAPDNKVRTYVYGEAAHMRNVARATHLTGIIDENNVRFAWPGLT